MNKSIIAAWMALGLAVATGAVVRAEEKAAEGNAAAHIKASLIGTSQTIPVRDSRLALGRWQGIYIAEFDGPRERHFQVTVLG